VRRLRDADVAKIGKDDAWIVMPRARAAEPRRIAKMP
jgi:hypothetical protein